MRNNVVRSVALFGVFVFTAGAAQAAEEIKWAKSFESAIASAKKSNKLVMVNFYTDWCVWCKRLDKDTYPDKRVVKLADQFVSVKVNAEKEGVQVAKKYQVTGFPTILFINGDGGVEGKIGGYLPPDKFTEQMTQIQSSFKDLPVLEARYKSKPDSGTALKLAAVYAGKGKLDRAETLLATGEKAGGKSDDLAKAYNAVGDAHQEAQRFDKAVPLFRKAAAAAVTGQPLAYARLSIAACFASQNKLKEALAEAKVVEAMPNAPADLKGEAKQMIESLKKMIK